MFIACQIQYLLVHLEKYKKDTMKTTNFYSINSIVNANCVPMVDGSKWIVWALQRKKEGIPLRSLNRIADLLTK